MNIVFVDYAALENCENPDSYGLICVGCNACGRVNPKTSLQDKLKVLKERLEDSKKFDRWSNDEDLRKIQEKNNKKDIEYLKKQIEEIEKLQKGDEGK